MENIEENLNFDTDDNQIKSETYIDLNDIQKNDFNQKKNINIYNVNIRKKIFNTCKSRYYYSSFFSSNNTQSYIVYQLNDLKLEEGNEKKENTHRKKKKRKTIKTFFLNQKRKIDIEKNK